MKIVNRFILVLVLALWATAAYGTVWDTDVDWSDASNPNGVWSYRNASNGNLLQATASGVGGSPGGWSLDGTANTVPNLFNDTWGNQMLAAEFGGHGDWMVRWVSPVDGKVKITATMLQMFTPSRRMKAYLTLEGRPLVAVNMPQDANGTIVAHPDGNPYGTGNRNGIVSVGPYVRNVTVGSTINFIAAACGGAEGGDGAPTFVMAYLKIETTTDALDKDAGKNLGYIVVSPGGPSDGADFGPYTPYSTTDGLQEAFNYGTTNNKDVFVVGGAMVYGSGGPPVYNIDTGTTLTIPPAQNWRLAGGDCVFNYGNSTTDCLVIDSQKNCDIKLPLIVATAINDNYDVVKIKPTNARPDSGVSFSQNNVLINALVGGGNVFGGGYDGRGRALHLDATNGAIENNKILILEINACKDGIYADTGTITGNFIDCPFDHITNNPVIASVGKYNVIETVVSASGVYTKGNGVNISGEENMLLVDYLDTFDAGKYLVFGANAKNNLILATNLVTTGITNNATVKSSRIIRYKPTGFLTAPTFPTSNTDCVNTTSYLVVITITTTGTVTSWTITDVGGSTQTVSSALYRGQLIYLEPGEKIKFTYSSTPAWNWRALK